MRQLKSYNLRPTTKRRAFTLMEILIATGIFAGVMVIATGILGQSSAFRGKIRATRETSEDARKLADMITRDVRSANYQTYNANIPPPPHITNYYIDFFNNGFGFAKALDGVFEARYGDDPNIVDYDASVLMIRTKDIYVVYGASWKYNRVCRDTKPVTSTDDIDQFFRNVGVCGDAPEGTAEYNYYNDVANKDRITIAGAGNTEAILKFSGFAPRFDSVTKQQPFVMFNIVTKTKNFEAVAANARAYMEIQSAVTARSFAN